MARAPRLRGLILAALLASLVAGGCEASDKQDYINDVNRIQGEVDAQVSDAGNDQEAVDRSIEEIGTAVEELEELDVPADYREPHGQMVEALGEMRDQLEELKTADPAQQRELIERNAATQEKYEAAIEEMNDDRE